MIKTDTFLGNEVCCGSYAFINTVQDAGINPKIFEITMAVPFGISHRQEKDFSRLLTTYCDPHKGMDWAARLWGYCPETMRFRGIDEAAEYIFEKSRNSRCLVGPLDMGRLDYLIMPHLYRNMDHYITIFQDEGQMFCMDSEGIPVRRIKKEELREWLLVGNLPEANGNIHVRSFERIRFCADEIRREEAIRNSLPAIINNMAESAECGQGYHALENCWNYLAGVSVERWKLSFLYDISFLVQRKMLQQYWKELADSVCLLDGNAILEIEVIVQKQLEVLGSIFHGLQSEGNIYREHFQELGKLEKQLAEVFSAFVT